MRFIIYTYMKKIEYFEDFIINSLLEKMTIKKLPFVLSERLKMFLSDINHPISTELLKYNNEQVETEATLVDLHDSDSDLFTFAYSNKIKDFIDLEKLKGETNLDYKNFGYDKEIWSKFRTPIRIGKFIRKIFMDKFEPSGKPGEDVESFTTLIKSKREKNIGDFEIVSGNDLIKYYSSKSYTKSRGGGSTLHVSCMMYDRCEPYLNFYVINNVELIVMKDDDSNISGRALLWNISKIEDRKVNRKFMDRIYTNKYTDVQKFIDLAISKNWLYKHYQNSHDDTLIIDPSIEKEDKFIRNISVENIKEYKAYPYLDTLKFFNINDGILTNNEEYEYDIVLDSQYGGFSDKNYGEYSYDINKGKIVNNIYMVYCEDEDIWTHPKFTVRSEYNDRYLTKEYAKKNYKYSKKEEDWIPNNDAVYIILEDDWVRTSYARDNYIQCDYDYNWYSYEDVHPSNKWGCVPNDDAIFVITDNEFTPEEKIDISYVGDESVDVRWENDGTYFEVESKNGVIFYLDNSLKNKDIIDIIKNREF